MNDSLQRFLFEDFPVRGEHARVSESYREVLANHHYPPAVGLLLGEFLAAAALLSEVLKFEGRLTLQARGEGEIPLIMAEATSSGQLRAIARGAEQAVAEDFQRLLCPGTLCLTVDPAKGERYQGIVETAGHSLAEAIERYFRQSEQLATRVWLAAEAQRAGGLMLQEMPGAKSHEEAWQHLVTLAGSVTEGELLELETEDLLRRLYHRENLRVFTPKSLAFHCSCSRDRLEKTLLTLGRKELLDILDAEGQIDSHCEFCNTRYVLDAGEVSALLGDSTVQH